MKLAIAWNVWNNYEDLLLGSEIARLQNQEWQVFEELHLISQGGYPEPPTEDEAKYLDGHFVIGVNEESRWIKYHIKYKSVYRVLNGIRHAYQFANRHDADYALVTNADAWPLDLRRLRTVLEREAVRRSAVSGRIGLVTGLDLSWGSYAPFVDDHFLLLNIARCREHGVFDYEEPKAYGAHFIGYGGIHYMVAALMDERVPPGLFHAYTHLEDCVNHFGEKAAFNLLPWQYQPSLLLLHANATQEPDLHWLRAAQLRLHGLDRFPTVAAYCARYPGDSRSIAATCEYAYYRQSFVERARVALAWLPFRIYNQTMRVLRYERYARIKQSLLPGVDALRYYDQYRGVLPMALTSRRRRPTKD